MDGHRLGAGDRLPNQVGDGELFRSRDPHAELSSPRVQHRQGLRVLLPEDGRDAALQDAGLLGGDLAVRHDAFAEFHFGAVPGYVNHAAADLVAHLAFGDVLVDRGWDQLRAVTEPAYEVEVFRATASTLQSRPCIFIEVRGMLRERSPLMGVHELPRSSER